MVTTQDTRFATRFADMTASTFYGSNTGDLAGYTPSTSPVNPGMIGDIGRAAIYAAETQNNPFGKFMRNPLDRGDANLVARFSQSTSVQFDPDAGDAVLFATDKRPSMISTVGSKNFSRQVQVEVNQRYLDQTAQVEGMAEQCAAAIAANANVCYMDDLFSASIEYFSGSTHGAKAAQMITMETARGEEGFADELVETLWNTVNVSHAFKSTDYNAAGYNTKSNGDTVIMDKNYTFRGFNKMWSEAFNPEYLRIDADFQSVDSFATTAGKPVGASDLIAIVADNRAFDITPVKDGVQASSFFNPARLSWMYFLTYEGIFQHNMAFPVSYIFAKGE